MRGHVDATDSNRRARTNPTKNRQQTSWHSWAGWFENCLKKKFPRHWRHHFCSLLVQWEDKQSGTERRGVRTLYDNDTRDRAHIVVHLLSVLFMICMLMSFSTIIPWGIIWMYWFSNCHMNQSLDCFCCFSLFSCQQFIFCGRIILAGAMWGWQGSKEVGRGGSWGVEG